MGRHAGWLALEGGEASGAYVILIPEYDFSYDRINELILEGKREGARYEIILIAEGAKSSGCDVCTRDNCVDSFGHKTLGGIGDYVAEQVRIGTGLEVRGITLSHLQRGGAPCAYDRRMGRYFGIAAVDLIINREFGKMVSFSKGRVTAVPLDEVVGKPNLVDITTHYDTERYTGGAVCYNMRRKSCSIRSNFVNSVSPGRRKEPAENE
jgi:6-phosphofructokinase 1